MTSAWLIGSASIAAAALFAYTLPALRRLPPEKEQRLDGILTIDDAVRYLRQTGKTGWDLVAAAQRLVALKMEYSRRNNWDTAARAFRRGMGYCQQKAMALLAILRELEIQARPVYATRCKFPPARIHEYWEPERVSGHAWLVVTIEGEGKDVCPGDPNNTPGKVHFQLLSKRREYGPVMRLIGHVGSMVVNVKQDNAALKKRKVS